MRCLRAPSSTGSRRCWQRSSPVPRRPRSSNACAPWREREGFTQAMARCGFTPASASAAATIGYQTSFARPASEGAHELDVHWRIRDSEVLSRHFTYEELRADAVPLLALAPDAWAASPVHALLVACMHRGAHRHNRYYVSGVPCSGGDRLIWMYDLHLLAESFTEHEWRSATDLAQIKGLRGICLDGLAQARECFATRIPDPVLAALAANGVRESASDYLTAEPWRQQWLPWLYARRPCERRPATPRRPAIAARCARRSACCSSAVVGG